MDLYIMNKEMCRAVVGPETANRGALAVVQIK